MTNSENPKQKKFQYLRDKKPIVISGPCSAETEEQVIATAQLLAKTGKVDVLRAGIWKPRTMPGMFEGIGSKGLPWLQKAKKITGLPIAIEVANSKQVEEALAHEIDILWVGARTTVNPFSVQEVADALKGNDNIPVLIKNPVNPDIDLWSGSVERFARAGIEEIGLVHRGFTSYGNTYYRNAPMWNLAIEMKLRHPQLPILTDPSHICGRRDLLLATCQKAIDLDFNGLMIESHINPDEAWSDPNQQVTPSDLEVLLSNLIWRNKDIDNSEYHLALEKFRQQINLLDDELMQILAQRMKISDQIGYYKRDHNVTILQQTRWREIIDNAVSRGEKIGLSKEFITRYLEAVHLESINRQKKILDS